jgi:CRISPR/Cas system-associated endoribonuclease Cas2
MKTTLIALATAGVLASGVAAASPGEDVTMLMPVQYQNDRWDERSLSVNEREQRINDRIQRGMSDGRITDREARRLYRELNDIEAKERSFLTDGHLNRRETGELHRDLDRLRDHVREQIRDEQRY